MNAKPKASTIQESAYCQNCGQEIHRTYSADNIHPWYHRTTGVESCKKARCYIEFCCNEAKHDLTDYDKNEGGPVVGGYKGVWGYCDQHKRNS